MQSIAIAGEGRGAATVPSNSTVVFYGLLLFLMRNNAKLRMVSPWFFPFKRPFATLCKTAKLVRLRL